MKAAESGHVLPPCAYRGSPRDGRFSCAAQPEGPVTPADCKACPIPAAINHHHACLYLVPLRHAGRARFACRWFFDWGNDPAPEDWRTLCFCRYWFPRPPREDLIGDLAARRARYLRVFRGAEARMPLRVRRSGGRALCYATPGGRTTALKRWLIRCGLTQGNHR